MHPFSSTAKLVASIALGLLVLSPLPAMASEEAVPLPPAQSDPATMQISEVEENLGGPAVPDGSATNIPNDPARESAARGTPVPPTPDPSATDQQGPVTEASSPTAADAVRGLGNAHMGQGLERIATSGDPQTALQPQTSRTSDAMQPEGLAATWRPAGIQGIDVSSHQGNVDWRGARNMGSEFAYVKATEGTSYINPFYSQQYDGAASVGMVRGAYHFAIPTLNSSGAEQAAYFVRNGGGWSADGRTLPPLLDIEYNPYPSLGNSCFNLSPTQMVTWIRDFSSTIKSLTGRVPMIYTTTDWWVTCTGNSSAFADHPLHIAAYGTTTAGQLPNGWPAYTVWQYSSTGPFVGDSNVWRGSAADLSAFVRNTGVQSAVVVAEPVVSAAAGRTPAIGSPVSALVCGLVEDGCYQNYQSGQVHWSKATGAHATQGGVNTTWGRSGWERGTLGYPTTDLYCELKDSGCVQSFQRGHIYWTPATGAILSLGPIDGAWSALGRERSTLGYPTSNEICGLTNGGCYQNYQGGQIHWSPASGASATTGALGRAWGQAGWEKGTLGYPTSNEICGLTNGGCYQNFQGGQIHRSATTSPYATTGAFARLWANTGWEKGTLGYPTSNEICGLVGNGCLQTFQKGNIYTSPTTGTALTSGAIDTTWSALGRERGKLGYPTSNEVCGLTGGGCYQNYQGGQIHWSPTTGAHSTAGAIGNAWRATGWETGTLGYPTTGETCTTANTCTQKFQKGTLTWSPTQGITRS